MLHQRLKLEPLRPVNEGRAIDSAAHHHFDALCRRRHRHGLLENRNHPVLAAGVFRVVIVHVRLGVAHERRIVIKPFRRPSC